MYYFTLGAMYFVKDHIYVLENKSTHDKLLIIGLLETLNPESE